MVTFILVILIISLLILVHEWGHFYSARKLGVKVEEFGFGFPPKLFSFTKKGVRYSLNLLPLGGFVKIKGEDGSKREDLDSFASKSFSQRAWILSAGVIMNVFLCVVLLALGFSLGIPQVLSDLPEYASVRDRKIQVVDIFPDSPAAQAGLALGDVIVGSGERQGDGSINTTVLDATESLQAFLAEHVDTEVLLLVKHPSESAPTFISVTPQFRPDIGRGGIGIALVETGLVSYPWYRSPFKAVEATATLTKQIFVAFGGLLSDLVVRQEVSVDVAGPVGIAVLTGEVVDQGAIYVLYFIAVLSLNLAILNFIPFPALDGGRFLFLVIEKLRRKPVDQRIEGVIHMVGFGLLLLLVLLVTIRDIIQL